MGSIRGKITNKFGDPIEKATVALKNKEFEGSTGTMKAYLVQISIPKKGLKEMDNYLSVQITDKEGCLGQASTYF